MDPDPGKLSMPLTLNSSYIYVSNSPTKFIDSNGQFIALPVMFAIIGAVIGGYAYGVKYNWNVAKVLEGAIYGAVLGFIYGTIATGAPAIGYTLIGANFLKSLGRGGNTGVNFFELSKDLPETVAKAALGNIGGEYLKKCLGDMAVDSTGIFLVFYDISEHNCDKEEGTWDGSDYCHAYRTPFR
jgi:hypothetical protein